MNADEVFLVNKANENLKAAKVLESQGFYDIAASRIYYVMFYLAEALLLRRGLSFSSHSAVIAAFGKEFSRTGDLDAKFHQYLIKSQELRQTGDYGFHESVPADTVLQMIKWAEEFKEVTEIYLGINSEELGH